MLRIVLLGKGGTGKSTIASNLSAAFAKRGLRVLHVGCDPKRDSTAALLRGVPAVPVSERWGSSGSVDAAALVTRAPCGVDCVEAGGPQPGVGCGGRAVSRTLELLSAAGLLGAGDGSSTSPYDVELFDVLGDVVCGGFAAPISTLPDARVMMVASDTTMALYAANNIAHAAVRYASMGARLVGMIVNRSTDSAAKDGAAERFARVIGTRVIGRLPLDPAFAAAERNQTTLFEASESDPTAAPTARRARGAAARAGRRPGRAPAAPRRRTVQSTGEPRLHAAPENVLPEAEHHRLGQRGAWKRKQRRKRRPSAAPHHPEGRPMGPRAVRRHPRTPARRP